MVYPITEAPTIASVPHPINIQSRSLDINTMLPLYLFRELYVRRQQNSPRPVPSTSHTSFKITSRLFPWWYFVLNHPADSISCRQTKRLHSVLFHLVHWASKALWVILLSSMLQYWKMMMQMGSLYLRTPRFLLVSWFGNLFMIVLYLFPDSHAQSKKS